VYTVLKQDEEIVGIKYSGLYIPIDEDNRHYQEYLEWVAEGNTAETEEI